MKNKLIPKGQNGLAVDESEEWGKHPLWDKIRLKSLGYNIPEETYSGGILPDVNITASAPSIKTKEGTNLAKKMAADVYTGKMQMKDVPRDYQNYVEGEVKGAIPYAQKEHPGARAVGLGAAYLMGGIGSGMLGSLGVVDKVFKPAVNQFNRSILGKKVIKPTFNFIDKVFTPSKWGISSYLPEQVGQLADAAVQTSFIVDGAKGLKEQAEEGRLLKNPGETLLNTAMVSPALRSTYLLKSPYIVKGIDSSLAALGNKNAKGRIIGRELEDIINNTSLNNTTFEIPKTHIQIATTHSNIPSSTRGISPRNIAMAPMIERFNNWANYYGYKPIKKGASFKSAESTMKNTFNRHNTFFRGVVKPYTPEDIAEIEKMLGKNASEDEILQYVSTHPRESDPGMFISPTTNAAIYGGAGKTAMIRRKFSLGSNPKTWIDDADFDILFFKNKNNPKDAITFPWSDKGRGHIENELLAPEGTMQFIQYVPEEIWYPFMKANGSRNIYLGNKYNYWDHGITSDIPLEKPQFKKGGRLNKRKLIKK